MPKNNVLADVQGEEDDTDLREDLELEQPEEEEEIEEEEEEEDDSPPEETDIEKQARLLGWHPQHEYRGPPGQWKDAKAFMEHGKDILPVLRDNLKRALDTGVKQSTEIADLKKSMKEQGEVLQELRHMARTTNERAYNKALAELKAQQREAVAVGDTETFDRVGEQIEVTEKERDKVVPPEKEKKVEPPENQVKPEVLDFVNANPWFNNDRDLNNTMQRYHVFLLGEEPGLTLAENLAKAKEMTVAKHPAKFGKPNGSKPNGTTQPRGAAPAQPTGGRGQQQQRGKDPNTIDSISDPVERAEARASFQKWQRQMANFTEKEYMETFNNPKADVLTSRRTAKLKEKARG